MTRHPLNRRLVVFLAVALAVLCLGSSGAVAKPSRAQAGIIVFAGSSMTSVLPQIDPNNTYSFGSSTALATQIANGAPCDVFMSANTTAPASLFASGVVEKPVNFTRNTLAVVVPKSNPANIHSVYDLTKPGIKIAEAASSVPVGSYTVQVLSQMGLNQQVQQIVVSQETSDANVVAKVALGQVDAGFVYLSDYVIDPAHLTLVKLPAWSQPKITYSLAIVAKSANRAAAHAFVAKVLSKAGQRLFVKDGFLPIAAPTPTIARIVPKTVKPGAKLTITGTNLATTTSVTFRGVGATFHAVSRSKLTVVVPKRAKTGTVTVTNPAGRATAKIAVAK
jgi:molybdate transport system substrate-binding protein